jgi:putative restriction endonuclease
VPIDARPPTAFVAITDWDWFNQLRQLQGIDEVNFWQPNPRGFLALEPGEPFLFKLHSPRNRIVGGGVFARHVQLPLSMAWEAFGAKNGVKTLGEMRRRVERYRTTLAETSGDYEIGCILLEQPTFFEQTEWLEAPDWKPSIQVGRRYRLDEEPGLSLWRKVESLMQVSQFEEMVSAPMLRELGAPRYGPPVFTRPRLGQGSFQAAIVDAYGRRCAVTGERVLPVLEAAHIVPYGEGGEHRVDNGLLLRRDLHALFERGYLTVARDLDILVSKRLKEEFHNGDEYMAMAGRKLMLPSKREDRPNPQFLDWHNEHRFVA